MTQLPSPRTHARGFTIVEMSVVLVVIALIVGAVTVGRDVYRSAAAQRMSSDFVQGWLLAYDRFVAGVGTVPADNFDSPTGLVRATTGSFLCGNDLLNAMLGAGIALPTGRGEGLGDRYVYQDSRGIPHEAAVCFGAVPWSEPYASVGNYQARPRNVMRLQGLTPELATMIDTQIDGRVDARHGRFREIGEHNNNTALGVPWSRDETNNFNGGSNPDAQVAEVSAYLRMGQ
jgi:prepilin-type N-terminal cleavage/methylation domain-containing protein